MRSILAISAAVFMCALSTVSAYQVPAGVATPTQWPAQASFKQSHYNTLSHTHFETMTYYDTNTWQMRDVTLSAPTTDGTLWNGTTLYMFNSLGPFGESCQALDMGFGMPLPDWFLFNSSAFHTLYQSHKYNKTDMDYHKTLWTRKYSVDSVCSDCGPYFNYYSDAKTGLGYKLEAPSPFAEMVIELSLWKNVTEFPAGLMALPPTVNVSKCITAPGNDEKLPTVESFLEKMATRITAFGVQALETYELAQFHMAHSAYVMALAGGRKVKSPSAAMRRL